MVAFSQMAKNEGMGSWFTGCQPTVYRAMCLNVGMLTCYDQAKDFTNAKVVGKNNVYVENDLVVETCVSSLVCA